jgi:hypothetical protein
MADVIVERIWDRAHTGEELQTIYRNAGWCFQAHGVRSRVHILASDGLRGCCLLDAPDAEAVRMARRSFGVGDPERLWAATIHGPVRDVPGLFRRVARIGADAVAVLVERSFADPARIEDVWSSERQDAGCLDRGLDWGLDRDGVELLMRFVSRDRTRMLCLCEAPDMAAVERANTAMGLPFDRAWTASVHFDD